MVLTTKISRNFHQNLYPPLNPLREKISLNPFSVFSPQNLIKINWMHIPNTKLTCVAFTGGLWERNRILHPLPMQLGWFKIWCLRPAHWNVRMSAWSGRFPLWCMSAFALRIFRGWLSKWVHRSILQCMLLTDHIQSQYKIRD